MWKPRPPIERVSLDYPHHPSNVPCPLPRWTRRVHVSIASPSARPSPPYGRVDIHIVSFEACLGFTRVTARWIAQPPKAAFVTRLRPVRLLVQAARQLPDQSTTLWVESSSTSDTRLRGAPYGRTYSGGISRTSCPARRTPGPNGARRGTPPSPRRNARGS